MSAPVQPRRGRRVALSLAVLGLIGTAVFGALWAMQMQHAHRLSHQLASTQSRLHETQARLAETTHQLSVATALSTRRKAVLLQAQSVLSKVDPLLSSVDGVQRRAGDLQIQGNTLSGNAESLIQTTITLVNYLVQTNTAYVDYTYVNTLINDANSELDNVRADEVRFAAGDSRYNGASATFSHKADAYSAAVRTLQKQLRAVTGP